MIILKWPNYRYMTMNCLVIFGWFLYPVKFAILPLSVNLKQNFRHFNMKQVLTFNNFLYLRNVGHQSRKLFQYSNLLIKIK